MATLDRVIAAESPPTSWWPETGRATHAVVDLDAITGNLRSIRDAVSPAGVIAVVKANAYGHGAVMVAEAAVAAGAIMLAVSTVDEGLEIREAGIASPILVLAAAAPPEYAEAFRADLSLSIAEPDQIRQASRAAREAGRPASLQIKVETGMNRYGCDPATAVDLAMSVDRDQSLRLAGVFTHFADADGPDTDFTHEQIARFSAAVQDIRAAGIEPGIVHHSNTAGAVRMVGGEQSAVRLGIGLYGLRPDDNVPLPTGMRQAMTIRTRVAQVRTLRIGDTVSYGRTYTARVPETVALLPIGYADGLRRAMSEQGWVDLKGHRAPIRGRVCMDQVVVGCPDGSIRAGDRVVVLGDGRDVAPTFSDTARVVGTINYEIATGIAHRVPRWYLREGRTTAVLRGAHLRRL